MVLEWGLIGLYGCVLLACNTDNHSVQALATGREAIRPVAVPALPEIQPTQPPMKPLPPIPQERLDGGYGLGIEVDLDHPPAELVVLPNREPLGITVTVERPPAPVEGFIEQRSSIKWNADAGRIQAAVPLGSSADGQAVFHPPQGSHCVTLEVRLEVSLRRVVDDGREQTAKVIREGMFQVLTPVGVGAYDAGMIDGFSIGEYLDPFDPQLDDRFRVEAEWPIKHPDRYQVPTYFYKASRAINPLRISPNVRLGLFVVDFPWMSLGETQYIALDLNLVRKLEDLIALMRAEGRQITTFEPIYGFRPPSFNIGKILDEPETTLKKPFSMHQYGRAVDFIIDEDGDGRLDDLNGDGVVDVRDAAVIMEYVNRLDRQYRADGRMEMVGGAGLYESNDFLERVRHMGQTPYIHVDTRGFLRDNGDLIRWPTYNGLPPPDDPA